VCLHSGDFMEAAGARSRREKIGVELGSMTLSLDTARGMRGNVDVAVDVLVDDDLYKYFDIFGSFCYMTPYCFVTGIAFRGKVLPARYSSNVTFLSRIHICFALRRGYVLRNASLGFLVLVRTSCSVLTQT
jgi:hypothetical protein